jgi:Endonuclease NucS
MPHKPHYVITPSEDKEPVQAPLKEWVRQNIGSLPEGFYQSGDTSHILRRKLVRLGWQLNIADDAVFAIKPDNDSKFGYAQDYINDLIEDEEVESESEDESDITFSLEKDMQMALRLNIGSLENGLKIVDGGKERSTIAGRIDITAEDAEGKIVVIELKAIEARPDVIAQILSYMESVNQEEKMDVRGIIVASDFSDKVKLASRQIPQLRLVKYSFQFNFNPIR